MVNKNGKGDGSDPNLELLLDTVKEKIATRIADRCLEVQKEGGYQALVEYIQNGILGESEQLILENLPSYLERYGPRGSGYVLRLLRNGNSGLQKRIKEKALEIFVAYYEELDKRTEKSCKNRVKEGSSEKNQADYPT